ncbi:PAS/PAC sensor hybrid histidine kinase [Anabaenopsis circularis NIES-21]|uniref:Circadian input-output histidine kinase CikA n=1 Tax=Anabaenopsis circularis NIES-21 TaxID=1085406 RepID=A0A1Z4GDY9_9CYAN|nr:PAS/PAC sensor hybrid histidine kinase [Anabaenopsis circularis NIES-21]
MTEDKKSRESEISEVTEAVVGQRDFNLPEFMITLGESLLESITDGCWFLDREWRCIYMNHCQIKLFGIDQENILGKNFWELLPETVDSILYRQLHQAVAAQISVNFEYFHLKSQRWLEHRAYPSANGIYVLTFDITEKQAVISEQAQCISDRQREEQRKAAQYAVTRVLAEATTLVDAVPAILQSLCESLGWQLGVIWQVDSHQNILRHVNSWQSPSSNLQAFIAENQQITFAPGMGLPGRIWVSHQPTWIAQISEDKNFTRATTAIHSGLNTVFGFPILLGDEMLGVIECFSSHIQAPDEDLLQMMATIGSQIGQFMERKRTEVALRESQELFQSFMQHSPITGFIKDADGRYVYVNALVKRLFNWEPADLIGKTDFDLFPFETAQQVRSHDLEVLHYGQMIQYLETVQLEDREYHFMTFKFPFQDAGGRQLVAGMSIDISEQQAALRDRIQAEAALNESEENLRLALQAARMVAWSWDAHTGIIHRSANACDVLGLLPEMLTASGEEGWNLVHPDDLQQHQAKVQEAIASQGSYISEFRFLRPDNGEIIWVEDRGKVNFDQAGNLIGVKGALFNVSDAYRQAMQRKQVETALRLREERFSTLFNGMEDWVLVYHLTSDFQPGQFIEVNEQACKKLGYHREELLTMSVAKIIDSSSINAKAGIERLLVEQHIVVESVHTTKDGQRLPVEVSATLFTLNGLPTVQAICRDITERKLAEAEREKLLKQEQSAREAAETANRIKDEFLAVLSHELRTPLNPILGWTQLLRSRKLDGEATERALVTIERNARLQTQLIEDLLDISRILRGKIVLNVATVNLTTTIEAALETVRLAAEAKNIHIQTLFSPDVGKVSGDAGRLQQVMWNLLSNAIKFTPDNGQVEIRLEQVGKQVQIQVKDTGKGINPEFLPFVFDYFRQEDSTITRKFGGLGLGLAIARHITELHGGTVKVESLGEGLGATFTIRLPVIADNLAYSQDDKTSVQDINLNQIKILTIDDDADMRDLLVAILKMYDAEVKVAASAAEALILLAEYLPDVLISDIGMPDVDGYTLMQQIKTQFPEKYRQIPAIALTAYAAEYDQRQALAAGFQLHLAKPVVPEELVRAIASVIHAKS